MPKPFINNKLLESHVWNSPKNSGKNRKTPIPLVNIFTNKNDYYTAIESLRQALVKYFFLVDRISILKSHQDWVFEIFYDLIEVDTIINNYEAGIREYNDDIRVHEFLKEKSEDILDKLSNIPYMDDIQCDSDVDKLIDELCLKLEAESEKIKELASHVYYRLIRA